jgi:hypothetical protein
MILRGRWAGSLKELSYLPLFRFFSLSYPVIRRSNRRTICLHASLPSIHALHTSAASSSMLQCRRHIPDDFAILSEKSRTPLSISSFHFGEMNRIEIPSTFVP